jgi:hypothetical protein
MLLQGVPALWDALAPHLGQTQSPPGPEPGRVPPIRPPLCAAPRGGPVPSPLGIFFPPVGFSMAYLQKLLAHPASHTSASAAASAHTASHAHSSTHSGAASHTVVVGNIGLLGR